MLLVRILVAGVITVLQLGCYPSDLGGDRFRPEESRTSEPQGPGFDSPHLHPVDGGVVVDPPTTSTTSPSSTTPSPVDMHYRYYEHSARVTALQMDLGMKYVDGVYGPNTRSTHVDALGGPTAVLYRNYPEIGQTPTPCSHGCLPGDGHYELPTLGALINEYFLPEDRALARRIAFCESSGQTHDIGSAEVSDALAVGWFQHLAKYWQERSEKAGWKDYDPFNGRANVAVAAWLYYSSGVHHWNPSKACWGE